MINGIKDLQDLVRQGFTDWQDLGDVSVHEKDGLLKFNYTSKAQYAGRWNEFEKMSRGLAIDKKTGDIVARPFDKFFNWGEGGRTSRSAIRNVWEKVDGSLGIGYVWRGEWCVHTRGVFDSDQAMWAEERLRKMMGPIRFLIPNQTLLFEIIYPENMVIVDYGERESLVLLAIRSNLNGTYWSRESVDGFAEQYGFDRPANLDIKTPEEILKLCDGMDATMEGFVAEFACGTLFKFKSREYMSLSRLVNNLSWKNTVDAVQNMRVHQIRQIVPEKYLGEFNQWVEQIQTTLFQKTREIEEAFFDAPKHDRGAFAKFVNANHKKIAPYLFLRFDGKNYFPLIFKREF